MTYRSHAIGSWLVVVMVALMLTLLPAAVFAQFVINADLSVTITDGVTTVLPVASPSLGP